MQQRIKFSKNNQIEFFKKIKDSSKLHWDDLAIICGVSDRTLRDWARGKFTPSLEVCGLLSSKFNVSLPELKILDPYWYIEESARRGGLARFKLYGAPGTVETRRQAGIISQKKRLENPDKYRLLGCNIRKEFKSLDLSENVAEFCGILLGDGGITNTQVTVTLNNKVDKEYSGFVAALIKSILGENPKVGIFDKNVIRIMVSGVNLISELERLGLKRGNKVGNQVAIPGWILKNNEFAKACIRGLFDTDGCLYSHRHSVNGKEYINVGINFHNHSLPLVNGFDFVLKENGFKPSISKDKTNLFIYDLNEVKRFFALFKPNNVKHKLKMEQYLKLHEI